MGHRLSKIYTRTGDDGTTGLGDGARTEKSSPRVRAMGEVDELNCLLGLLLTESVPEDISECLHVVQHALFDIGGELSIPGAVLVGEKYVTALEAYIDQMNQDLPPLKEFILPGGNRCGAICHLARAICRRTERAVVALGEYEETNVQSKLFLNRLSDLLFVIARRLVRREEGREVYWQKEFLSDPS